MAQPFDWEALRRQARVSGEPSPEMEGLAATASGLASMPVAGWAGLTNLMRTGDLQQASNAIEESSRGLTYEPRTQEGVQAAGLIQKPLEWLNQGTDWAGQKAMDATGSPLVGGAVKTALDFAVPGLLGKGVKAMRARVAPGRTATPAARAAPGTGPEAPPPPPDATPKVTLQQDFDRWLSERTQAANADIPPIGMAKMAENDRIRAPGQAANDGLISPRLIDAWREAAKRPDDFQVGGHSMREIDAMARQAEETKAYNADLVKRDPRYTQGPNGEMSAQEWRDMGLEPPGERTPPTQARKMTPDEAMQAFRDGADLTPEMMDALKLAGREEQAPLPKGNEPWDNRRDKLSGSLDYYEAGGSFPEPDTISPRGMARPGTVSEFPTLPRDIVGAPGEGIVTGPTYEPNLPAPEKGSGPPLHGGRAMFAVPEGQYFKDWNGHVYLKEPGGQIRLMQRAGDPAAGNPLRHAQGLGEPLKVGSATDPGLDPMMVDRIPDPFPPSAREPNPVRFPPTEKPPTPSLESPSPVDPGTPQGSSQGPRDIYKQLEASTHVDPAPLPPPSVKEVAQEAAAKVRRKPMPGTGDEAKIRDLETGEGLAMRNGNLYRRKAGDRIVVENIGDPSMVLRHQGSNSARLNEGSSTAIQGHGGMEGQFVPADPGPGAAADRFSPGHPLQNVRRQLETGEAWRQGWNPDENGVYQKIHGDKMRRIEGGGGETVHGYYHEGGGGEKMMKLGSVTDLDQDGNRGLAGNYVPRAEVERLLAAMGEGKEPGLVGDVRAYAKLEPVEIRQPKAEGESVYGKDLKTGEALRRPAGGGEAKGNVWEKGPGNRLILKERNRLPVRHHDRPNEWVNQGSDTDLGHNTWFNQASGHRLGPATGQVEMGGPAFEGKAITKEGWDQLRRGELKKQIRKQGGDANPDIPEAMYREVVEEAAGRTPTVEGQPDFFKHPQWRMPDEANSNYMANHPDEMQGSFSAARGEQGWQGFDRKDRGTFNVHAMEPNPGLTNDAKIRVRGQGGNRNPPEAGAVRDQGNLRSQIDREEAQHLADLDAGRTPDINYRDLGGTMEGQERFPFQVEHKREQVREQMLRDRGTQPEHSRQAPGTTDQVRWNRENRGLGPEESGEKPYRNDDARLERLALEQEGQLGLNEKWGLKNSDEMKYQGKAELEVGMGPENAGLRDRELARPADERARLYRQMFGEVYDLKQPWEGLERREGGPSAPPEYAARGHLRNSEGDLVGSGKTLVGPKAVGTEKARERFARRYGIDASDVQQVNPDTFAGANKDKSDVVRAIRADRKARRPAAAPGAAAGGPYPDMWDGDWDYASPEAAKVSTRIESFPEVGNGKPVPGHGAGLFNPFEKGAVDDLDRGVIDLMQRSHMAGTGMINRADPNFPIGQTRYFGNGQHANFPDPRSSYGERFQADYIDLEGNANSYRAGPPGWQDGFIDKQGNFYNRQWVEEMFGDDGMGGVSEGRTRQMGRTLSPSKQAIVDAKEAEIVARRAKVEEANRLAAEQEAKAKALSPKEAKALAEKERLEKEGEARLRAFRSKRNEAEQVARDDKRNAEFTKEAFDKLMAEGGWEAIYANRKRLGIEPPSPGNIEVRRQEVRQIERDRRKYYSPRAVLGREVANWKPPAEEGPFPLVSEQLRKKPRKAKK